MRVFGNLMNRIQEVSSVVPEVGMGATVLMFSDRHPATVVEVLSPKRIIIQGDNSRRTDKNGMSESQQYEYSRNPNGEKREVTLRKNGRWIVAGESLKQGTAIRLGVREEYYDYSF